MTFAGKPTHHLEPVVQQKLLQSLVFCALFDPCEKTCDAVVLLMGVFFGIHFTRQEIAVIKEGK